MDGEGYFNPRTLVLGALGSRAFAILGFLIPLDEENLLDAIDTYCGVSVGAVISLLLIIGYDVRYILTQILNMDIFGGVEDFMSVLSRVKGISSFTNKGVLEIEETRSKITNLVLEKFGYIPNLGALYNCTGKSLVLFTLNISSNKVEILTPLTHPNVNCVDAVITAVNLPFVFQQNSRNSNMDCYFSTPYPVDYFDDGETEVLGVYTKSVKERSELVKGGTAVNFKEMSSYIFKIVTSLLEGKQTESVARCSNKCKNVEISVILNDPMGYSSSIEDKARMLVDGYDNGVMYVEGTLSLKKPEKWRYKYPEYLLSEESGSDTSDYEED